MDKENYALMAAYRATVYVAFPAPSRAVGVRVGETSAALDAALARAGARSGLFVTAANPRSRLRSPTANRAAHRRLAARLHRAGWRAWPHEGRGDDGAWPPETGFFVLDLPLGSGLALAAAWGQNAVVAYPRSGVASLHATRLMAAPERAGRPAWAARPPSSSAG